MGCIQSGPAAADLPAAEMDGPLKQALPVAEQRRAPPTRLELYYAQAYEKMQKVHKVIRERLT